VRRVAIGPYARAWLDRLLVLQPVDRAVALAGLAFTALFPLIIVYDAVTPTIDGRDFASDLIARFGLRDPAAESLRQALAPPGETMQGVGLVGAVLVIASALSFARALQRLYESAFQIPALGSVRGLPSTLVWLALIPLFVTMRDGIDAVLDGPVATVAALTVAAALWTLSPFVLLGRRLPWRRLLPTGIVTALAMSALATATVLWMTRTVGDSAERYGLLGVGFALVSWLILAGFALVGSAAAGAVLAEQDGGGRTEGGVPAAAAG